MSPNAVFRPAVAIGVRACAAVALSAASALPGTALAALGQGAASIDADSGQFRAQRQVTQLATHRVHELQMAGGVIVREYLGADGMVFAVSWSGMSVPDLQALLGANHARYMAAASVSGRSRRPVILHDADLVIEAGGRTHAFHGFAYLPSKLPPGFDPSQIK
jgi:Protein of unknown function (DUF2844)